MSLYVWGSAASLASQCPRTAGLPALVLPAAGFSSAGPALPDMLCSGVGGQVGHVGEIGSLRAGILPFLPRVPALAPLCSCLLGAVGWWAWGWEGSPVGETCTVSHHHPCGDSLSGLGSLRQSWPFAFWGQGASCYHPVSGCHTPFSDPSLYLDPVLSGLLPTSVFAFVVGVPGRVAVNTMAIGESGLASKPASPVGGPTQVRN